MSAGRPTKYQPEFAERAYGACLLGATNDGLAEIFNVSPATIDNWIATIPEFLGSIKAGREESDEKVAESLYNTALAGNTTAQIFWLKNRRPKEWRDKQEIDHTSGGEKFSISPHQFVAPPAQPTTASDEAQ